MEESSKEEEDAKILRLYFGSWCAKQVLHIYEKECPNDDLVRKCIEATELFAQGEITQEDLDAASAAASGTWRWWRGRGYFRDGEFYIGCGC